MNKQRFNISREEGEATSIRCEFNDGKGSTAVHFFVNPHHSLEHVDDDYIKDRFSNVKGVRQAKFIREEYGKQIGAFLK